MLILAIDTSCDETAVAVSRDDCLLANVLSSQIQSHKEWGGVVPSLARRKHEELFDLVLQRALKQAKVKLEDIDAFAVTRGPGLAVALEVGIRKAKELALQFNKPLIPVNHMEGHLYSAFAKNPKGLFYNYNLRITDYEFPLLVLLISGGHTELVLMMNHGQYEVIGQTLDDAIGESYDKVGRMLDFGYPAGPVVEKVAEKGNENAYELPIPMKHSKDLNMSYSGLKTAAMKLVNDELGAVNKYGEKFEKSLQSSKTLKYKRINEELVIPGVVPQSGAEARNLESSRVFLDSHFDSKSPLRGGNDRGQLIADISASFQKAAVDQILLKTKMALEKLESSPTGKLKIHDLVLAGGVSQNKYLRKRFKKTFPTLRIHYPGNKKLYTDNAGMIAIAAYFNAIRGKVLTDTHEINRLDRDPNWRIDEV